MTALTCKNFLLSCLVGGSCCLAHAQTAEDSTARLLINGLTLHELRTDAPPPDLNVYDSYEEAQRLEAEIVQMYREIRAAELSLIQRQTLERSLESTLTPLSERADVDQKLLINKAQDAEAVKNYQKELGVVLQETDAIVANAEELLNSLIEKSTPPPPPEIEVPESSAEQIADGNEAPLTEAQIQQMEASQPQHQMQQLTQQQAELQKQIEQDLAIVERTLEDALGELAAAKELVKQTVAESDKRIEEKEKELAEVDKSDPKKQEELTAEKEKEAELKKLDAKIDVAREMVKEIVEKQTQHEEVTDKHIEKAEEMVEEIREALAAVIEADLAVPETSEQQATKKHTERAVEQMQTAQAAMAAAAEAMAEMQKLSQMLAEMESGIMVGDMGIARMQALEVYSRARVGTWIDLTEQMRGKNLHAKPVEVPADQRPALWDVEETLRKAPTARKVNTSTPHGGGWIFVGDWYVLSRYDNAQRANLHKVYPPESILDIDAQYRSEDGKIMKWEYESYLPPKIVPYGWESWKIYYFYTELMFEEEMEVWLAIGSDDRSDVWINDLPIWHSSNQHKNWNPAEGFRKVFFKKGRNKVLVRLENGHHAMGFSMFMNLSP